MRTMNAYPVAHRRSLRHGKATSAVLCLLLAMALLPTSLASQSYPARTYGESDGLPHQSILGIAQTNDGLLWFATMAGLVRYDSHTFEVVPLPSIGDPDNPNDHLIATDERGVLYAFAIRYPFAGHALENGRWQALPQIAPAPIESSPPHLTDIQVSQREGHLSALLGTDKGQLFHLTNGSWRKLATGSSCVRNVCSTGDEFVIGHANGLSTLSMRKPAAKLQPVAGVPSTGLMAIARDQQRNSYWVVGRTWIGEHRNDQFTVLLPKMADPFFPDILKATLLPDEHGGIYFGERPGFLHFSPSTGLEKFNRPNALDEIGAMQMFRDREGIIWAGGVRGIAKFAGRSIANRTSQHDLDEDEVTAILQLRDGRMVLGHDASLTILGSPSRVIDLEGQATVTRIMSMVEAPDGTILAAASRAGLLRIHPDTLDVSPIKSPAALTTREPSTRSEQLNAAQWVDINRDGDVIVAGWQSAWWLRADGTSETVDLRNDLPSDVYFRQVLVDGPSLLFAARNVGVIRLDGNRTSRWTGGNLQLNNVTCLRPRADGSIWIGSSAGLLTTTADGSMRMVDFGSDQLADPVYFITDDRSGNTWFGTNNGVAIWDGARLRRLTKHAGLAGSEANRGASCCDQNGHMWVGFDRGLTTFYLERESDPRHGPTVSLLAPRIDGVVNADDDWMDIEDHKSVEFRLRSISSRDEDLLLHEYWLEGLEGTWSPPAPLANRTVTYRSLPPGQYRFHVRVTDSVGLTSSATTPWLTVMPPWWRSWWFLIGCATATLLLFAASTAFINQRRNTRALKRAVDERTADLRTEHIRLHAMLTSIADGVIGTDNAGVIIVWNPTATRLTGWEPDKAIGRRLSDRIPAFTDIGASNPVEVKIADGSERWFEFTASTVSNESNNSRVIAFRDVTERRKQERLLTRTERLESLGILAGGIAHDFNNLLTVVLGNLSILEFDADETKDKDDDSEALHTQIREAVLRARDLTQQLLTFSKGGAPVRRLGSLASVIQESTQLALSGANVGSNIDIEESLHDVEFDLGQISQVIHNLVLNARQAMPDGGVVTVRSYNADCFHDGRMAAYALIEVRDEGSGIAPTDLEHIFDPYYSTKPQGTGLGLATSHSIVKRHDGFLTAESQVGAGSTFRIHLPAPDTSSKVDTAGNTASDATIATDVHRARILCMDDDSAIRAVLDATMHMLGHRVTVVADGQAAIEAYRQARAHDETFDVVVLDMTVPGGMGGIETMKHLRDMHPEVTAIATTGYSTEPVRAEFKEHGFAAMLSKPFGLADVQSALARAAASKNDHRPA